MRSTLVITAMLLAGCGSDQPAPVELVTVNSRDHGDSEYNVQVVEIERSHNTSKLRVTRDKRMAPTASTMFLVRAAMEVAKAREFEYFINLSEWSEADGSDWYLVGFTNTDGADIRQEFGPDQSFENSYGQPRGFMSVAQYELLWPPEPGHDG